MALLQSRFSLHTPTGRVSAIPQLPPPSTWNRTAKLPVQQRHGPNKVVCMATESSQDEAPPPIQQTPKLERDILPNLKTDFIGWDDNLEASRAKELFWFRVATLSLGAVLIGERITGKGVVQQLELHATNVPVWEIEPFLGLIVAALFFAAFIPRKRPKLTQTRQQQIADRYQFTFGRLSCVGLGATILSEVLSGKGVLALLQVETGVEAISEAEAIVIFILLLFLTEDFGRKRK